MHCPACAHENPPDSRFRLECGHSRALRCGSCDAELPAGAKFCNQCGTPTAATAGNAAGAGARPPSAHLHEERAALMQALGDDDVRRRELSAAQRLFAEMGADGHAERLAGELAT